MSRPREKQSEQLFRVKNLTAKNDRQALALERIKTNDITFLVGSAGTGKSLLPIYMGLLALRDQKVSKIILARPAVEAGESLGFLPGDADEKLDPYMRPLVDCIEELVGSATYQAMRERGMIEFVPFAFMRGRTFNNAFIIYDEVQNATKTQLKMALTRIGEGSRAVVTADPKQIDLEEPSDSAINDFRLFQNTRGIGFVKFADEDVVRSATVVKILECYARESFSN